MGSSAHTLGKVLGSSLALGALCLLLSASAWSFGSINRLGQKAEHERITRAALACAPGETPGRCFEEGSLANLAGTENTFGQVGGPDVLPPEDYRAHCDDADYMDVPGYPQDRATATATLLQCVNRLREQFAAAVSSASDVLGQSLFIRDTEVGIFHKRCPDRGFDARAKCRTLQLFGAALHGIQDFYSHSNWGDIANPGAPISLINPPGLGHTIPAEFLNLRQTSTVLKVDKDLTTGCFNPVADFAPGNPDSRLFGCYRRVKHRNVNKDKGTINPETGAASNPKSPRGEAGTNFENIVDLSIEDTRRQWREFSNAVLARYGPVAGGAIVCALTHDYPLSQCHGSSVVFAVDKKVTKPLTAQVGSPSDSVEESLEMVDRLNRDLLSTAEADGEVLSDRTALVTFDSSAAVASPLGDPDPESTVAPVSSAGEQRSLAAGIDASLAELQRSGSGPAGTKGIVVLAGGMDSNPDALVASIGRAHQQGVRVSIGILARLLTDIPSAVEEAVLDTGGLISSSLTSPESQDSFVALVQRNGLVSLLDPNGPADDGALAPGVPVTGEVSNSSDRDHFTFEAEVGKAFKVTVRSDPGQELTLTGDDIGDDRELGTARGDSGELVVVGRVVHSGPVTFDVISRDGEKGSYTIQLDEVGEVIRGTTGDDSIACAGDESTVFAGAGADKVKCGGGDDLILSGGGDEISAGAGDDIIRVGRPGSDQIDGGTGHDTVVIEGRPRAFTVRGGMKIVPWGKGKLALRNIERVTFTLPERRPVPPAGKVGSGG